MVHRQAAESPRVAARRHTGQPGAGAAARGGVSPRLAKRCWPAPFEGGGRGTIWPFRANARLMRRVGRVGRRGRCNACGRRWSRGVPRVDWSGIRRRPRWSPVRRRRSGEGATRTTRATVWARRFAPGGKRWGHPRLSAGAAELAPAPASPGSPAPSGPLAAPEGSASAGSVRALATLAGGGWTLRAGCAERVCRGTRCWIPGAARRGSEGHLWAI